MRIQWGNSPRFCPYPAQRQGVVNERRRAVGIVKEYRVNTRVRQQFRLFPKHPLVVGAVIAPDRFVPEIRPRAAPQLAGEIVLYLRMLFQDRCDVARAHAAVAGVPGVEEQAYGLVLPARVSITVHNFAAQTVRDHPCIRGLHVPRPVFRHGGNVSRAVCPYDSDRGIPAGNCRTVVIRPRPAAAGHESDGNIDQRFSQIQHVFPCRHGCLRTAPGEVKFNFIPGSNVRKRLLGQHFAAQRVSDAARPAVQPPC